MSVHPTLYRRRGKRALDLGLTLLFAPVLVLLGLVLALLVRMDLGTPVLFLQRRIGRGSRPFTIRKLRTMTDQLDSKGRSAPDAERLTWLGAFLRRTSLDEIPEFLNVLKGEMSLVGPRPLLPEYLPRYSTQQARRHEVLPGLTGLTQIRGRNALTWEKKLEYDVEYVDRLSFLFDLSILSKTLWILVSGQGVSAPGYDTMPEFLGTFDDGRRVGEDAQVGEDRTHMTE